MTLVLDLLRHGEAEPTSPSGDAGRALTPAGRAVIETLARRLATDGWRPSRAFASPARRAQDTARIVLEAARGPALATLRELEAETDPAELLRALRDEGATDGRVLLVGHQPLLGRIVGQLTGGPDHKIAPGSLVTLDCPHGLAGGTGRIVG